MRTNKLFTFNFGKYSKPTAFQILRIIKNFHRIKKLEVWYTKHGLPLGDCDLNGQDNAAYDIKLIATLCNVAENSQTA